MPIPADPEEMNDERAEWAEAAIEAFMDVTGTDRDDALCDLLCNLMHWCDRSEGRTSFENALNRGRTHYTAETEED